ncbi:hypothetical protein ACP70R_023019 [Stipagrostis hirtigluma subsp. patula]
MMAAAAEGDAFRHSDDVLVNHFLRAKIAGKLRPRPFLVDADVCSAPPYELAERHAPAPGTGDGDSRVWYFFSPVRYVGASRTMRWRTVDGTGGKERWHPEGKDKPVKGSADGYLKKFSYHVKTSPGVGEKPGWLMAEYGVHGGDTVLCKVYKSPRGPGRSCASSSSSSSESSSGRKRKARDADEHLQAAPPSARARLHQTHDDATMLFAGSLDQELLSDNLTAAPELGETQHLAEDQPEPQLAPAGVDGSSEYPPELEEMKNFLMADDEDDAMALQVPYGVDPISFYARLLAGDDQQLAAMLLARPEPGQQLAPSGVHGDREQLSLEELKTLLMTDDDEVPDGVDPMAFFKGLLDLSPEEDATVETAHGQLTNYNVLDGPSTTSAECTGGLPIPAMDPAYIELALSAPDPADIEELLMASPAPYDSS